MIRRTFGGAAAVASAAPCRRRLLAPCMALALAAGVATGLRAQQPAMPVPATFAGLMPCADCPGVAQTLTLRADGLYRLRRTYLGKPEGPFSELGHWKLNAAGTLLMLRGESDTLLFAVAPAGSGGEGTLRLLDRRGQPIVSDADLALRRTERLDPVAFTDCDGGVRERTADDGPGGSSDAPPGVACGPPPATEHGNKTTDN
ncbi:copper resistance protein NlpE [Methylibium sp.]|uniref:copper resistance protein NlpE n=1 Tax=Methylibium sp. TaxID=2067992 RepID=UPI003D119E91